MLPERLGFMEAGMVTGGQTDRVWSLNSMLGQRKSKHFISRYLPNVRFIRNTFHR